MKINTLEELELFVLESNSIKMIEKVVKASLGVNYIIWDNTTIEEIKEATIQFINDFKDSEETPLFLITNIKIN
jgi:hypothetical protein